MRRRKVRYKSTMTAQDTRSGFETTEVHSSASFQFTCIEYCLLVRVLAFPHPTELAPKTVDTEARNKVAKLNRPFIVDRKNMKLPENTTPSNNDVFQVLYSHCRKVKTVTQGS
ncbi:hypothetical protein PMIN05_005997 [Paraphaeosphaeria minitans]